LAFGRPRNKIVTEENAKPRRGTTGIWTTSPVGVGIGNKGRSGRGRDMSTEVKSSLDVPDNALNEVEMSSARSVHEKTSLLNGIRDLRAC
jgi:hypothetical protein